MLLIDLDRRATAAIHHYAIAPPSNPLRHFYRFLSHLGDGLLYAAIYLSLRFGGHSILAHRLAESIAVTWTATAILKSLIRRPRPTTAVDLAYSRSTIRIVGSRARRLYARSFPSQHAACALAAALAVGTGRGTPWLVLALLIAIAIGFSRVLVGAHYLGDVIVGWAMGIAGWMVAVSY